MGALGALSRCLLGVCRCCCATFLKLLGSRSKGLRLLAVLILLYSISLVVMIYSHTTATTLSLVSPNHPWQFPMNYDVSSSSANNKDDEFQHKNNEPIHWQRDSTSSTDEVSACLLVMDDNHYLIEWIAYHYHAANLRNLIIVNDEHSMTSPYTVLERWKGRMDILLWNKDEHYMTPAEFTAAQQEVTNYFGNDMPPSLVLHRARQRLFYYKCLQNLQARKKSWVLLTDSDEFVRLNYDLIEKEESSSNLTALPIQEPGSVSSFLNQHATTSIVNQKSKDEVKEDSAIYMLQSSPCVQVPRLRFAGGEETTDEVIIHNNNDGYNASDFLTLRWTSHAPPTDYKRNKISKAIVDVSRIPPQDLLPVDSIHVPVRAVCQQRRLHVRTTQSFLVIHHYLGDLEQYLYRENDARILRTADKYYADSKSLSSPQVSKAMQPWLNGFLTNDDVSPLNNHEAIIGAKNDLLANVGKLQPKSWQTYDGPENKERCALCFFGLPRAYKTMVLPSIVRNLLIPNARHNCDIYVHYYKQYEEEAGRRNRGGKINPDDIFLLEEAAKETAVQYGNKDGRNAGRVPSIQFTYDTDDMFLEKRKELLDKYHNTMGPDGKPAYFPWGTKTYTSASLDNMVRQWHSIEFAFKLMDFHGKQNGVNYSRVGMFRNDAMYLTPIDIALMDKGVADTKNKVISIAPFARYPINDRMVYGPYDAIKIWSTKRFELIEKRVALAQDPGFEMHSERFLNGTVFPAMEALGYRTEMNRDVCFVRTRADEAALANDCTVGGMTRGFGSVNKKELVESIVGKNCTSYKMGFKWLGVGCGDGIKYFDGKQ
mmetsp:Transcript_42750/g.103395  ORF Transcript_42750/g.103395 Transcript_42750/m.103395 type:complete len:823 (+) Transcript_42750:110-2578(+)